MRRPRTVPSSRLAARSTTWVRRRWLTSSTALSNGVSTPAWAAVLMVIETWFGRHEPPKPTPAFRNEPPMRLS